MGRPPVPIAQIGRRLPELGRVKDGIKVPGKGQPKAIDTLRFTSQDPTALAQVADFLGGEVKDYKDPKSDDTHELITPVAETPVILPPDPLGDTPMYELYSGGGRERWCDGVECEMWRKGPDGPEPYEVACLCAEAGELACKPTVHLSVILPYTRLGGVWRWTTHSHNAALELPGMVDAIQAMQSRGLTRATLRVERRTQVLAGVTRKFVVPVLGVDATADELASGQATLGSPPPASSVAGGVAAAALPAGSSADHDPPVVGGELVSNGPGTSTPGAGDGDGSGVEPAGSPGPVTPDGLLVATGKVAGAAVVAVRRAAEACGSDLYTAEDICADQELAKRVLARLQEVA